MHKLCMEPPDKLTVEVSPLLERLGELELQLGRGVVRLVPLRAPGLPVPPKS